MPLIPRNEDCDPVNKEYILFHLREALEALTSTIADMESAPDYDEGKFGTEMAHLYNHVNTAWNSRFASKQRISPLSDEDFEAWRQFPSDIDMSVWH